MCPTSNFQTGTVKTLAEYPFQQFIEAGLAVCINTDNRTVSDTTLTKEFMKLATWYQLSYDEMKQLTKNACRCFLSPNEKLLNQKLIKRIYSKEPPLKWRLLCFFNTS